MKTLTVENLRNIIAKEIKLFESKEIIAAETSIIENEINTSVALGSQSLKRSIRRGEADEE